jgi:NAD(P) transhydrogenase subunit alpha
LVPEVVAKLKGQGLDVVVERGAGAGALIPDEQYEQAGARMVDDAGAVYESDVVVKVAPPSAEEVERLHSGGVLIGFLQPLTAGEAIKAIA